MATSISMQPSTARNWADDDEDDFDLDAWKATVDNSAPTIDDLGPLQAAGAVEDEYVEDGYEVAQFTAPAQSKSRFDYSSVHPDYWPTFARAAMDVDREGNSKLRPAYVEMSIFDNGLPSPQERRNYSSSWRDTKVMNGCNMKMTAMMKPSPLQQSMTWEEDSEGKYIKEAGILHPSMSPPVLYYDFPSDEEQDEARTPPGSPPTVLLGEKKGEVEEVSELNHIHDWPSINVGQYDPVTATVDLPINEEYVEVAISCEFADFNHISDSLDIDDILGDAAHDVQHSDIHEHDFEFEDAPLSTGRHWEKKDFLVENIHHDQAGKLICVDNRKPISNANIGVLASFTPPGSPTCDVIDDDDFEQARVSSSITSDEDHIPRDPVVDLMTVNTMAHQLLAIVKTAQVDLATDDATTEENSNSVFETAVPDAESRVGDEVVDVHTKALGITEFANAAQAAAKTSTATVEAAHIIIPDAKSQTNDDLAEYKKPQCDDRGDKYVPGDSTPLIKTTGPSPDLKYTHDPTNTSLVWNTVAVGWFAFSSVLWGRIAVAVAGTGRRRCLCSSSLNRTRSTKPISIV